MKNFTLTLLMAAALLGFSMNANAQASADGTSTTTVIAPIEITAANDLAFGNVTEDGTGGTITVTAASSATATGADGAQAVDGTVTAGSFNVTGQNGNPYNITVPGDGVVSLSGSLTGSAAIPVSGFTPNISTGIIGTDNTFYVGGTITLAAGQAVDSYTGTYTVTVQYQ